MEVILRQSGAAIIHDAQDPSWFYFRVFWSDSWALSLIRLEFP
jgi:hypothetical protein